MNVDGDIDISGGPGSGMSHAKNDADMEGEAMGEEVPLTAVMARDAESDEIVHQLERGLRKWEGFGEEDGGSELGE